MKEDFRATHRSPEEIEGIKEIFAQISSAKDWALYRNGVKSEPQLTFYYAALTDGQKKLFQTLDLSGLDLKVSDFTGAELSCVKLGSGPINRIP